MKTTRVGVLRGGPSSEYDVSMKTGASVLEYLSPERYTPVDIVITKQGDWLASGRLREPGDILSGVDVVFNALHGAYGEDGTVQRLLSHHGVSYTGSDALASAVSMHKGIAKEHLRDQNIKLPRHVVVGMQDLRDPQHIAQHAFQLFPPPYIIKPLKGGSSVGLDIAKTHQSLAEKLAIIFSADNEAEVIIEEHVKGKEATCGVIDHFRGQNVYVLPPIEIVPEEGKMLFDYEAKYSGASEEICPGRFSREEKEQIEAAAKVIHDVLNLSHYSRSDFIVTPRGPYFLEVNTLPGLTKESLMPKALEAVGATYQEFLDHVIDLAMDRKLS